MRPVPYKLIPLAEPCSFAEFVEREQLQIVVEERSLCNPMKAARYYANDRRAETKDGWCLCGTYGNGETPEAAVADYATQLRGRLLVLDAYKPTRREIQCPNEWKEE